MDTLHLSEKCPYIFIDNSKVGTVICWLIVHLDELWDKENTCENGVMVDLDFCGFF